MPRKGAKSTLASALAMVLAFGDHEGGAEVIIGAASRDQAGGMFHPAKATCRQLSIVEASWHQVTA